MKIQIDSPCHENWDAMTPTDKGAFCLSCQKQVVDFSNKTLNDIKSFFQELPLTEKVCGRFEDSQLEALSFDDFFRRFRKWRLLYKIAIVCFFTFGLGLFSCAPQQDPSKEMIMGTPAPVQDTISKKETTEHIKDSVSSIQHPLMGSVARIPADTLTKHGTEKVKTAPAVKCTQPNKPKMGEIKRTPPEKSHFIQGDISIEPETERQPKEIINSTPAIIKTGADSTTKVMTKGKIRLEK